MDDADRAAPNIEALIASGMARARQQAERSLPSIGVCHWCESPVGAGRTFCSRECCDDYEHDRVRRKAAGQ